ncbi:MAG: tyrosine--tRNA ligase [Candidatus Nanoarchaeia archaeon]|jgi:tyrosyl-tRNA synthetase
MNVDEKIRIIKSFAEEIISEEDLINLLKTKAHPVAYDGFEPSGQLHIAQGLMRAINVNKLTSLGIKFKFYIADWFAMLNNKMGGDLDKIQTVGKYFIEIWKACGMDLKNVEFVWASDVITKSPTYMETVLRLSTHATVQRVLRCSQIMGREESTSNPSSQILYPLMQTADMKELGVDIAQLGLDQRKVNMLARELFPKLGLKAPVAIHNHMLLGLQFKETDAEGIDRKIAMKMSKSKPDTAIFMTDSREDVIRKFQKAYCPEGKEEDNPILEYAKYIVFEKFKEITVKRPEKFGGNLNIKSYEELKELFLAKKIHPMDLKTTIADYIDQCLIPVRKHFETNKAAKALKDKVLSFQITR